MDHESPGRDEREACDRCRNRAGKARLNNAINEVVEPAWYSPHTSLGIGVIADIARCVPTTGVTCCKLTRCRLCGKIIGFGLKRAPGSRTRSRQGWEKRLRETPPLPFKNDRLRRRPMDSVRQALAIRQQPPGIPLLFERITQGALYLPCSAATQIARANHSAAVVPTAKDGHGSESQGIQGRNRQ